MQASGRIAGSPTMSVAMKIASQPLRVTATSTPIRAPAMATASGIGGIAACANKPSATAAKTDGKMRPPRKPAVLAMTTAPSFKLAMNASVAGAYVIRLDRQLPHLVEPFEEGDRSADGTDHTEDRAAGDECGERGPQSSERGWAIGNAYTATIAMIALATATSDPDKRSIIAG